MTVDFVGLVEHEQTVLAATLVSLGLTQQDFLATTGLDFGAERHRFENRTHSISADDSARLAGIIEATASSDPQFPVGYAKRCAERASGLIDLARSLSAGASSLGPEGLSAGLASLAAATRAMAPALAATPLVRAWLGFVLGALVDQEASAGTHDASAGATIARLAASGRESEGLQEMRSCYRIAFEVGQDDEARELVVNRSPTIGLVQVEAKFPRLRALMQRHIDDFGWVRTQGGRFEATSAREMIQRLQMILLRWDLESIKQAADPQPPEPVESILGFAPSPVLASLIDTLRDLSRLRCFRLAIHLQAECLATPFHARLAAAAGCTREQLLAATPDEIQQSLDGGTPMPLADLDRRIHDGFSLERSGADLQVATPSAAPGGGGGGVAGPPITGQSVSVGRAVGRVRIIHEAGEILDLSFGDVIVTGPSTPDRMGIESVFPTREGAPRGTERVAAVVADEGGLLSHAATISRELGIPCIVGAENATSVLVDGQVVEVDATREGGKVIVFDAS